MPFASSHQRLDQFLQQLGGAPAVLVLVAATEGSVPRETGTWMAVFADETVGTIGGGHLEYEAIARARAQLARAAQPGDEALHRFALGPSLGQCCGGVVQLRFERIGPIEPDRVTELQALRERLGQSPGSPARPVALFGGGHVGHALARLLVNLPFELTWIDSRDGVFPSELGPRVHCEHSEPVQAAVASLVPGSLVLIMSFSHAEDLDVLAACLWRQRVQADLPYIGLIGSKTKWAVFRHRLEARGFTAAELAQVTSPIGVPGIAGKEPEVIAVAVAAQLLQAR